MGKEKKSASSTSTRKKPSKKGGKEDADQPQQPQRKLQRGQKKLSKAQRRALPKAKQYIPPPKPPAPPIPDPLDGQGLARTLPAELVVVLRRLGKKDDVTRRKGLDELRDQWVLPLLQTGGSEDEKIEREIKEAAVLSAIPVWLHNLASLLQSPSHRPAALQLHDDLLAVPALGGAILDSLSMSYLPGTQDRDIIGSWLVAALEEGRRSGGLAFKLWDRVAVFGPPPAAAEGTQSEYSAHLDLVPHLSALAEYFSLSILDPPTLHRDIHPAPVQQAFAAPAAKTQQALKGGKQKGRAIPSPAPTATPPVEEDEASVEERWARYRVGGLVGLGWLVRQLPRAGMATPPDEFAALFDNGLLWSALGSKTHLEDITPIGTLPPIRRAAYSLLDVLLNVYPETVGKHELLQLLSATVLGNCWAEKEAAVWETAGPTIVRFLTKHRLAWQLAAVVPEAREDDDDDDEGDDDDDTQPPSRAESVAPTTGTNTPALQPSSDASSSGAFDAFLGFVSAICPLIPHLTYPLLVVVVSTIPSSILPIETNPSLALQNLFSHLWSPVDARQLSSHALGGQPSALQACLQATIDIILLLLDKAHADGKEGTVEWIVKEQVAARIWGEGVVALGGKSGRRGTPPVETEAKLAARVVACVVSLSQDLTTLLFREVERITLEASFPPNVESTSPVFLPRALKTLAELRKGGASLEAPVDAVIVKVVHDATEQLFQLISEQSGAASVPAEALVGILQARPELFPAERVQVLSQGLQAHLPELVATLKPELVAALFSATIAVAGKAEGAALRSALWNHVESASIDQSVRLALTSGILASKSSGLLSANVLDSSATEATRMALTEDDSNALAVAQAAIGDKDSLSAEARDKILTSVTESLHTAVDGLLNEGGESTVPGSALAILSVFASDGFEELVNSEVYVQGIVAAHHLVILVPRLGLGLTVPAAASQLWASAVKLSPESKKVLSAAISRSLTELLGRVTCRVGPGTLVDVALATDLGAAPTASDVASAMLPSADVMLALLSRHTSQSPHPSLPVIDPMVPCVSDEETMVTRPSDFDATGRSRAARFAEAGLALLRADRSLVETFPWLLHTALGIMILAGDASAVPGASRGLYTPETAEAHLEQVIRDAEGALSFSLALVDEAPTAWHKATVAQLRAGTAAPDADYLQRLLSNLRADVVAGASDIAARAFREVLSRHMRQCDAGLAEGEIWLQFAMVMGDKVPDLSLAIILSIKPLMLDSKPFETAQNRLANGLTGISIRNVNEKGLPALRLLVAAAPPADSASIFLPQQRAVFALRHVGGWLTSDDEAADDLVDEVDVRVAELYTAIAPIVQDVTGGHWDAMFDLVEGSLGSCSLDDPVSYPLLYAGLLLLKQIRDLCQTNKTLRASWEAKDTHMGLVVNLFIQCREANSVPLQMIHAVILDLLRDASPAVMARAGLPELCDLLRLSSSAMIQSTAYRLLKQVIKQRTQELVLEVEASIASEDEADEAKKRDLSLPAELIAIVDAGRHVDWQETPVMEAIMGQLFAWMAILDHFDDASRTLRWAYVDQLNSSKLLEESLLVLLFAMLGVSEVGAWNFPASQYAVDEFYTDLIEPEDVCDLNPLASHVYYRSLVTIPSMMRAYYESLKDRQLSMSLLAFTARNYSPVMIQHELSALREPGSMATLTEEGLNVRITQGGGSSVAGSGAAEAIASYVVDEQPMEIGIRLPAEFPLKGVDVRDLRRVGVPENKWRGWLMSVQQTITSRNGLILEALTVFKKNVSLHFEGVVECAICYSIISVTDRTLPTKPCRTCKNRFHASCLFKWFNSSHSSSCPMCRSLF